MSKEIASPLVAAYVAVPSGASLRVRMVPAAEMGAVIMPPVLPAAIYHRFPLYYPMPVAG